MNPGSKLITKIGFVDLYIGDDFADITGYQGAHGRCAVPEELMSDVSVLRTECTQVFNKLREEEFSLNYDNIIFRVTAVVDVAGKSIFILRRSAASIRPLTDLGLPKPLLQKLLSREMRGLVLVAGEMATGKTTTASSLIAEWLMQHGGIAIALEDPVETPLNALWGQGRCIQISVSRRRGGYKEAMPKALRTGASAMLIGEIRDSATAAEVLQASINGHFIISTIHAGSLVQAVERLSALCTAEIKNADQLLAEGLSVVLWQSFSKSGAIKRLTVKCLEVKDSSVKAKIRDGKASALNEDVEQQAAKLAWAMQEKDLGAK